MSRMRAFNGRLAGLVAVAFAAVAGACTETIDDGAACSAAAASACMGGIWAKAANISLVFIVDRSLPRKKGGPAAPGLKDTIAYLSNRPSNHRILWNLLPLSCYRSLRRRHNRIGGQSVFLQQLIRRSALSK